MSDEDKIIGQFDHFGMLEKMKMQAQRVERRLGAEACIVICIFRDGDTLRFQDAGRFPMPPDQFYNVMRQGHLSGDLNPNPPKKKIIRPN